MNSEPITVVATVNAPLDKVWDYYNQPEHITKWAFASDDWEAPFAEKDLRIGGKFKTTMAAKDKSASFDLIGTITKLEDHKRIEYDMEEGRHVIETFEETPDGTKITVTFEPENENPPEFQKQGWQAILNNFKKHVESE